MTVVSPAAGGVEAVAEALRAGAAVVIPLASPLPYVVAGLEPSVVNAAKGRPPHQPCGRLVDRFARVAPHVDLDRVAVRVAQWIAVGERVSVLVPIVPGAPAWLAAGSAEGRAGITVAWLPLVRPLAEEFGSLSVSSGNPTSRPPAVSAAEADRLFGGERLVLDGDAVRARGIRHGSATIVEVGRGGSLRIVRPGVQDPSRSVRIPPIVPR